MVSDRNEVLKLHFQAFKSRSMAQSGLSRETFKGFFDNIDHEVLIAILSERISDNRFIRLIRKFLNAGYVEDWGIPQIIQWYSARWYYKPYIGEHIP